MPKKRFSPKQMIATLCQTEVHLILIHAARTNLTNQGGGELITKGRDGKIRSKDTITPGNDPNPPRDTEH
jgi:hypothetical protein